MQNANNGQVSGQVTLSRNLGLFTITMIGIGGMIGAGVFVLTGIAAGLAGPALVLAFLLNGLVTLLTAMAYAELGSAFPEAGGGYLWVREGLGGLQGFLAGWMSWFAHAVAGSLYALGFGRFAAEFWLMAGLPTFGLPEAELVHEVTLALMTLVIVGFTALNYRGASETGMVGNIVTVTKIAILGLFALFGVLAMLRTEAWHTRFLDDFLPNGLGGVLQAMGLTFVAFEGYEIIAQSGEEVQDPKRNIPRAIFLAVLIAVTTYIFISVVMFGAVRPPDGVPVYQYLGSQGEIAVVDVAQQTFPFGTGAAVLLFSGLVATMSALNATTYSSSRVSFAMGRDCNLPAAFSAIHPQRHTPYVAVLASGALMLAMAWLLPIENVAAAADIMFLLLFAQVNLTVMRLRRKMPDLERGFRIPFYPAVPLLGLSSIAFLAVYLFTLSPTAWYVAIGWIVVGLLAFLGYFSKVEALEKPREILHEEVLVSRDYSVLVPVATPGEARILGHIGTILAAIHHGEVLALHVVRVPPQLTLGEGRLMLREGRAILSALLRQARERDVPVHTIIRLSRNVADAVRRTAEENASDLIVLGWPGYTDSAGSLFGSVTDPIVADPPTDIALVRYRQHRPLRSVLVPVAGGPTSRRAVKMAVNMAGAEADGPATVTLLNVIPEGAGAAERVRAEQALGSSREGVDYARLQQRIVEGVDVVEAILAAAQDCDLIVLGATREPLFKNLLMGNIPEQVSRRARVTVIMVKRRSGRLHALLRQTVLASGAPEMTGGSTPGRQADQQAPVESSAGQNASGTRPPTR